MSTPLEVRRHPPLERGGMLFVQDSAFEGIYIVTSGCVLLQETRADGSEHVLDFRVAGETIGFDAWQRGRYPYTARVSQPATLCRLPWPPRIPEPSAALVMRVLAKACEQLDRGARSWLGLPAAERVSAFIEEFARRLPTQADRMSLTLPLTRAELGSYLGLAEETVVRAFAQLRKSQRDHCTLSEGINGSEST